MYKDIYDYIIPPWDPRYDYLDDLFTKYNFENIIRRESPRRIYYYMPYELVINEYLTNYVDVHKTKSDLMNPWENWISKFVITRVCEWSLRLTIQEYFDLLVLHINRKSDRPKCAWCGNEVPFGGRVTWGYNQSYWWNDVSFTYCCDSCAKQFQAHHPEFYPDQAKQISNWMSLGWKGYTLTKSAMTRYLKSGKITDDVIFYLARLDTGMLKLGLTLDLDMRYRHEWLNGNEYSSMHKIIILKRDKASYLEASIKLKFDGKEYLPWNKLHEVIMYLKDLLNRPIVNPFE